MEIGLVIKILNVLGIIYFLECSVFLKSVYGLMPGASQLFDTEYLFPRISGDHD